MKMKLKKLGIFLIPLVASFAFLSPVLVSENFVAAEVQTQVIQTTPINDIAGLNAIKDNLDGNYILMEDISIGDWTPVKNFTGTFDGNGHTLSNIIISESVAYQGFFGSANGATIKNLRIASKDDLTAIQFNLSQQPDENTEYFAGTIVGYASGGTVISNCEVESSDPIDISVSYKSTVGGLVGVLKGSGTRVENSANYTEINLQANLKSAYTLSLGGVVGEISDSAKITNAVSFKDVKIVKADTEPEGDTYVNQNNVGLIAGSVSGALTEIRNSVSFGNASIDPFFEEDQNYVGSVIGYISNLKPDNGNISNIAYLSQSSAFGFLGTYNPLNITTNDYVARIPASTAGVSDFFFSSEYNYSPTEGIISTFKWYEFSSGWSNTAWVMNVISNQQNEFRLQAFQNFVIRFESQLDEKGVLEIDREKMGATYNDQKGVSGQFKENLKLFVKFGNHDNIGYYEVTNIRRGGRVCDSQKLEGDEVQSADVAYKKNNDGSYEISIYASSLTAGDYSFEVSVVSFLGSVYVDPEVGGGSVRFSGTSQTERQFSRESNNMTAEARAGSMYVFKNWNLYYKASDLEDEDVLRVGDNVWKLKGEIWSSYSDSSQIPASASLSFKFGESSATFVLDEASAEGKNYRYLDQDFLLEAVFELDPYKFTFERKNAMGSSEVSKILVGGNDISDTNGVAAVGKSDIVEIKIFVNKGFQLNKDVFIDSIRDANKQPQVNSIEEENGEGIVYTFSFNTGRLSESKMSPNEHNKFTFDILVNEVESEKGNSNLGWIIGGSVGGGVVLIGLGIFLWYYFGGGFGHGGGSTKSGKSKKADDDYKKYYY